MNDRIDTVRKRSMDWTRPQDGRNAGLRIKCRTWTEGAEPVVAEMDATTSWKEKAGLGRAECSIFSRIKISRS